MDKKLITYFSENIDDIIWEIFENIRWISFHSDEGEDVVWFDMWNVSDKIESIILSHVNEVYSDSEDLDIELEELSVEISDIIIELFELSWEVKSDDEWSEYICYPDINPDKIIEKIKDIDL